MKISIKSKFPRVIAICLLVSAIFLAIIHFAGEEVLMFINGISKEDILIKVNTSEINNSDGTVLILYKKKDGVGLIKSKDKSGFSMLTDSKNYSINIRDEIFTHEYFSYLENITTINYMNIYVGISEGSSIFEKVNKADCEVNFTHELENEKVLFLIITKDDVQYDPNIK